MKDLDTIMKNERHLGMNYIISLLARDGYPSPAYAVSTQISVHVHPAVTVTVRGAISVQLSEEFE